MSELLARIDRRRALALGAVILVFALSVAVRVPRLDSPMAEARHADGTARVLRHMSVWDEVGLLETHFMMRTTGTAPADRYQPDIGYLADEDGLYYYVSFPPLYPLAPYLALKALDIPRTALTVRMFNLALQALGCLVIFLLARRLTRDWEEVPSLVAASVAASVYAIAPMLLWYHSVAYTSASLSTPLLALAVYLAVRLAHDEESAPSRWLWIGYITAVAMLAYADWLAVTYALGFALFAVIRRRDHRLRTLAFATGATVAGVLALTALQYSSVAGFSAFLDGLSGKYVMRSGLAESSHHSLLSLDSWRYVLGHYRKHFGELALFAGFLGTIGVLERSVREDVTRLLKSPATVTALGLSVLATVIHHLALFSHTAVHDFDLNKATIAVALLVGLAAASGFEALRRRGPQRHAVAILVLASVLVAHVSLLSGFRRNFSTPAHARDVGAAVQYAGVRPDEVVFIEGDEFYIGSSAIYYAGRNLTRWRREEHAARLIEATGATGGVLFVLDDEGAQVVDVLAVAPDGSAGER